MIERTGNCFLQKKHVQEVKYQFEMIFENLLNWFRNMTENSRKKCRISHTTLTRCRAFDHMPFRIKELVNIFSKFWNSKLLEVIYWSWNHSIEPPWFRNDRQSNLECKDKLLDCCYWDSNQSCLHNLYRGILILNKFFECLTYLVAMSYHAIRMSHTIWRVPKSEQTYA